MSGVAIAARNRRERRHVLFQALPINGFILLLRRQQAPLQEVVLEFEHRDRRLRSAASGARRGSRRLRAAASGGLRSTEQRREPDEHDERRNKPDSLSHGGDSRPPSGRRQAYTTSRRF